MANTIQNTTVAQTNYQTNQNFDPDIQKMHEHWITGGATPNNSDPGAIIGIDDFRGQNSVTSIGMTTADLITSLNINSTSSAPASTPNTSIATQSGQESRCHTFYRILGLPVVNATKSAFYNPGLDQVKVPGRKITLEQKISIASAVGTQFEAISQAREQWAASTSQVFSVPQSIEAGVLALTSGTYSKKGGVNLRKFSQPFIDNFELNPFDFNVKNQTYSTPGNVSSMTSLVGSVGVPLPEYQDSSGNTVFQNADGSNNTPGSAFISHQHIIVPFMVDPRIDFSLFAAESKTCSGLCRRVAIPFVPSANYLKAGVSIAERPQIERIITERFQQLTSVDAGTYNVDLFNYVSNTLKRFNVSTGSTPFANIFTGNVFSLSQQQSFAQYLQTIQSVVFKLVDSMRIIHAAQGDYYWLPIPSISGPETGSNIRSVPLNKNFTNINLITANDFDVINNQIQIIMSGITPTIATINSIPDPGSYNPPNYKISLDQSTSNSKGDLSTKTSNTLSNKRNQLLARASSALQIVEMIMGEFSGLGLCDIVAVMGALYTMPLPSLIGFLDTDSYTRAVTQLGSSLPFEADITTCMKDLAIYTNGFYKIMDQVFQDYQSNNALNLT
ncbi:MAG TPA: hypothetical protein VII94_04720 [Candidatus Saccharimonadales bacterium]